MKKVFTFEVVHLIEIEKLENYIWFSSKWFIIYTFN